MRRIVHLFGRQAGLLAVLLIGVSVSAQAADWTVTEDSRVGFRTTQAGQAVEGVFESFEAEIRFDPEDLEASRVAVTIEIGSVESGSTDRDTAIRSAPLFDAATWPTARFQAERFQATGEGLYTAHGRLTLRDVTNEIELLFSLDIRPDPDDPGRLRAAASGDVEVMRLDYGVGQGLWKDTSMVPNEVTIFIEIRATRPGE